MCILAHVYLYAASRYDRRGSRGNVSFTRKLAMKKVGETVGKIRYFFLDFVNIRVYELRIRY